MNKINTKNHPRFLELGSKRNDQIVLMKQLERMEERMDGVMKTFLLVQGVLVLIMLIAAIIISNSNIT